MKIIIKIGESQLPFQVKDEYEKELCFKAQKIINDKLLAYSRVYYTTEETVLFKILLFDSVLSDLKDEGEDEELSQELFGKMQRPSKMEGIKDRIVYIMEKEKLSIPLFAKKIGIGPSTLLHIIRGRNAPSLQVVQAIHKAYPDIDLNWLIE